MKRLVLAALLAAAPASAPAQSMNVRLITEQVVRDICGPFIQTGDMWPSIAAAERAGYAVMQVWPDDIRIGAADLQPTPTEIEMRGSHAGTIRMSARRDRLTCSVGIAEGGVRTIAEAAEPHLRALGLDPVLDEREPPLAVSVWRGGDAMALIAPSSEFRPGSELALIGRAAD
ncbi:hypothetical protein [Brevundimonas sp.]|uniref:hypothetical protein n=1 Tax=Brevundimonas sp. TaxID=1871086 RepID=UPI0025EA9426|nr:hypothetical protein [Brevundimonas sp.]